MPIRITLDFPTWRVSCKQFYSFGLPSLLDFVKSILDWINVQGSATVILSCWSDCTSLSNCISFHCLWASYWLTLVPWLLGVSMKLGGEQETSSFTMSLHTVELCPHGTDIHEILCRRFFTKILGKEYGKAVIIRTFLWFLVSICNLCLNQQS